MVGLSGLAGCGAPLTILKIGNDRIDLLPHVREAVRALGFIRPEAAEWLAGELVSAATKKRRTR